LATDPTEGSDMGILWIILIVVVVLALFGFIGRSYW
jgi:flagellar basal body-associated protein FliL